ncbi:hypothetical protein SEA_COLUCCI_97 [Arthrobacter phage Colucci]|uniref:Uncharacterized protein n=1 Tax=Arthrobacter phage Colucci TaxID=2015834 RepID=A0A286N309_9CAUD|nr:hypothetical protein FDI27_gp097 [Arthrobacter phage Colucci]ASX98766.1 hypothetical protein SEA_COLUCCI_97 [Arthrobacter phage Colucci]
MANKAGTPQPNSRCNGNCTNPECGRPTRTSGRVTPETKGMPRSNKAGVCARCEYAGYTPDPDAMSDAQLFEGFTWSPELLADAVDYALEEILYDAA